MRKMLQQRFLGFFVLLLIFIAAMVVVSMRVRHYPDNGPLRQSTQSISMSSEAPFASDSISTDPPDDLAVIAMMATESDAAAEVSHPSKHAIILDQPISHHAAQAMPNKPHVATSTHQLAWHLQVGSFSSQSNAKQFQKTLRKAGWSVSITSDQSVSGSVYYRLYVGPFASTKLAGKAQKKINQQFHVLGLIVKDNA